VEDQADYLADMKEMVGKGYDRPSIEIEAPRLVIERRNRQMVETESPAFVKVSTNFKSELKELDATALKVWLYIALSINRISETAYPGLRKTAEDTDLAINTVRDAVDRLENKYNLLSVTRHGTKRTIYRVTDFVSANHKEPVSKTDTPIQTVSVFEETVSVNTVKSAQPELTRNIYTDPIIEKMNSIGMFPNADTSNLIDTWKAMHSDEKIMLALDKAKGKNQKYADTILRGWEKDGYPLTKEERAKSFAPKKAYTPAVVNRLPPMRD
jgi:Replication initiation and membrane attachment protein (DnaB).